MGNHLVGDAGFKDFGTFIVPLVLFGDGSMVTVIKRSLGGDLTAKRL